MGKHRYPMSQEERDKRSKALKGRKKSPETIAKMTIASRAKDYSYLRTKEIRAKAGISISKSLTGKKRGPMSEEHKASISKGNSGKIRTEEHNRKLGLTHAGSKSHFWKGGIATKNAKDRAQIMATREYRLWRQAVLDRDKGCKLASNECHGYLHVHHIKSWKVFPELQFEVSNGEVLCQYHHTKTDNYGYKAHKELICKQSTTTTLVHTI